MDESWGSEENQEKLVSQKVDEGVIDVVTDRNISQRRGNGPLGWETQRPLGTLERAMALELRKEHRCSCK